MSYEAIIAVIDEIKPIANADRIVSALILGNNVVVGSDYKAGSIVVFCPCDGILEDEFCERNNLFPVTDENGKKIGGGFFTRGKARVRSQKFRSARSEGFAFPVSYLEYTGFDLSKLKIGDKFSELNGVLICSKYVNLATLGVAQKNKQGRKQPIAPLFYEMKDVDQFDYYCKDILAGSLITITSKKHGTSGRYSYTTVYNNLSWWKRGVNKLIKLFPTTKNEYLVGTRRVVLLPEDEFIKEGFHGSEQFRYEFLKNLSGKLPLNMTVYVEICGWANSKPIMPPHVLDKKDLKEIKDKYPNPMFFSYGNLEGQCDYTVYRITFSCEDGTQFDLSWDQVKSFCKRNNLKHVFELSSPFIYDGNLDELKKKVYSFLDLPDPEDKRHYSEGVVCRIDFNGKTEFYKKKGFYFSLGEGILKDSNIVDTEETS